MENIEIERKFLLSPCSIKRFLREQKIRYLKIPIEQFYIRSDSEGVERYRGVKGRYIHTIKRGAGLSREEIEHFVSKSEYKSAKRGATNIIKKIRYRFDIDRYSFELDIFKGSLKGLNMLEIEFDSIDEANSFKMPKMLQSIIISEVTEDRRFTNGFLSKEMTIPTIDTHFDAILEEIEKKNHLKATASIPISAFNSGRYAIKALLYTLLLSIKANADAILSGDRDIERLHQLRVAMRKIRALFAQMEELFDQEWAKSRSEAISALMKESNKSRDLDVYLQKLEYYKELIDKRYAKGIDRLGEYIKAFRAKEQKRVVDMLTSEAFKSEMRELEYFCKDLSYLHLTDSSKLPIIFFVKKAIKYRYSLIVKRGLSIDAKSPAKRYHKLRIEFKKLRYMMEFFSNTMDKERVEYIMPRLKKMQGILGDFQDLQVQSEHLEEFLRSSKIDDKSIKKAVEALQEQMYKMQESKKREFREEFDRFGRLENDFKRAICRF